MTPHRILNLNALSTAACAVGMLATRRALHLFFGLQTPMLLDVVALGLLAYAAALSVVARRQTVDRSTLMAFAIVDGLWVAGSAVALFLFWANFSPVARVLVIAVTLAVEAFATLQYRAARTARDLPGSAV